MIRRVFPTARSPFSHIFLNLFYNVDHDIERCRGAFTDRFGPFGDDQLGAAAQFKNTEILIAENAAQAEGLEEFDGVIDRMGLDPDMTDGDGAGGCLWLAPFSAIWALILAFDTLKIRVCL